MNIQIINERTLNKKVFAAAVLVGFILNLSMVYLFGRYISDIKPAVLPKNPTVKVIQIKEKKKVIKKKKKVITKKRKKKVAQKKQTVKKASGKNAKKAPSIPSAVPVLPETVSLDEKEVSLPEQEIEVSSPVEENVSLSDVQEFRPVLEGEFSPTFGKKLRKLDKTAFGTASGRIVVYRPPPPKIKTTLPPPPKVKVKLWINPDGTVDKVNIVYPKAIGDIKIKQKIENYVMSWRFNAISSQEKQWAVTTIRFKSVK